MEQKFSEVFDINPKLKLNKNQKIDFVEMKNIESGKRSVVSEYKKEFKGSGSKFEKGDTLFARITPCLENGKISRYDGPGTAFGSTEFIVIRGKEGITLSNFAYYYSTWEKFREFCIQNMIGSSGRQRVPVDALDNWIVSLPSLQEQKEIADLLDSLDSKIELNKKMNKTLEEIAKTLFKSWFIDFDPVRAKAEGRPTGLSKEISDLFPDSFENSELGEIPRGWKAGNLGTFIEPKRGKVITKSKIKPGEVPVVAGGTKPPYYHSESNALAPIVTISASGTAGYVNIYYEDIWASDCSYINKEVTDFVFFAHSFLSINQERIYDLRHGAVQQHVYPKDLIELEMVTPPTSIIEDYENKVSTFHERIKCNLEEIKTLQSLRDLLLPKLISGELRITDAENLVEEAGI